MKNQRNRLPGLIFLLSVFIFSCSAQESKVNAFQINIPEEAIYALSSERDLDILLEEIGDASIVLLGESSHGTSEFYTWRSSISKRLIAEKDFNIITVEANWAETYPLNHFIHGLNYSSSVNTTLQTFKSWPTWMWANEEIASLLEWLRLHNSERHFQEQTGFYGFDVYGIWSSLEAIVDFLDQNDPNAAIIAREAIACFDPYSDDIWAYARATRNSSKSCVEELQALLEVVENYYKEAGEGEELAFNALQNAHVAVNAEHYFRVAAHSSVDSWNIRDRHMTETLKRIVEHHGPDTKIIVWAHNTHIGDARATDMAKAKMENVGELARDYFGIDNVYIVGFGTHSGEVVAASAWGNRREIMQVPPGRKNSWEWILHNHQPNDKIIFMRHLEGSLGFNKKIEHRAIGVSYNPRSERANYVPSLLTKRYDAFIFIDETSALTPLD